MNPGGAGRLVVVAGPSGVGKGTVVRHALELDPTLVVSVSATTRPPRAGESDGVDYHFVPRASFERLIAEGRMLEWAEFAGNLYGTPLEPVEAERAAGRSVVLEIDVAGARQIRTAAPDALQVFLAPPDIEELERRLRGRGTEDERTIGRRMAIAREELGAQDEFDAVVVNADAQLAAERLVSLIRSAPRRHP